MGVVRLSEADTSNGAMDTDARAINAAIGLFLERGIAQVKMTEIAEAADVGVATLYRHFATKAALAASAGLQLWQGLLDDYSCLVAEDAYQKLDGAKRLELLLRTYCESYLYQKGFATFFDELDRLVLAGDVDEASVMAYAQVLEATYPFYEEAYHVGRMDGSLAPQRDFALFYRSVAHALLSVAAKLQRGEVLPTDDFSAGANELTCLVDMAVSSLHA